MIQITKALQNLGLAEREAKTYLALLDLGESTVTKVSERSGIGRVHTYQVLTDLIKLGLASYILKNNIKYFSASDPQTLIEELHRKEQDLKKIIPELLERQKKSIPETSVELYRGREGINTIFKMVLQDKKPYFLLGGAQEACSLFQLENTIFVKHAEIANVHGKILARKKDTFFIGVKEEYRFIPDKVISSTTQLLWAEKTAIFVWQEPYYAILISNKEITKSNLATFNFLWSNANIPTKKDMINRKIVV